MEDRELVIIGAGPAGLSAARACGIQSALVLDRMPEPGGILPQCFHRGFGKAGYGTELTGPKFAAKLIDEKTEIWTDTFVLEISPNREITAMSARRGVFKLRAKAVILATGCRERSIGALSVTGTRPAGVYTAGTVQRMINLGGCRFGKRAVVLGSGDVGMIVAHHLTETGTQVVAVVEKNSHIGGLSRNKTRYLDPHGIPVLTDSTITELHGETWLTSVTVQKNSPFPEERRIACDTLITSIGLIPELELVQGLQPRPDWLFICGNAKRVHSMVDSVLTEGERTGRLAANYIRQLHTK